MNDSKQNTIFTVIKLTLSKICIDYKTQRCIRLNIKQALTSDASIIFCHMYVLNIIIYLSLINMLKVHVEFVESLKYKIVIL